MVFTFRKSERVEEWWKWDEKDLLNDFEIYFYIKLEIWVGVRGQGHKLKVIGKTTNLL